MIHSIRSLSSLTLITLIVLQFLHPSCVLAQNKKLPLFFSESKDAPAAKLNPGQMKIKVSKKKRRITMDAVFLSEGIEFNHIRETAAAIHQYDEISVPGIEECKPISDSVFWMHSETMGIHSRDYFNLLEFPELEEEAGTATGLTWVPIKKEKEWNEKLDSSFNDFAGYFFIKKINREEGKPPLVYIRYALEFDMDTAVPPFVIKAIVDFKGRSLAEGYIDAIMKSAAKLRDLEKKP